MLSKWTGEITLGKSLYAVEVFVNEILVKTSSLMVVFPGIPNRKSVSVWLEAEMCGVAAALYNHHHLISYLGLFY